MPFGAFLILAIDVNSAQSPTSLIPTQINGCHDNNANQIRPKVTTLNIRRTLSWSTHWVAFISLRNIERWNKLLLASPLVL